MRSFDTVLWHVAIGTQRRLIDSSPYGIQNRDYYLY